jgi:hypothetical protein
MDSPAGCVACVEADVPDDSEPTEATDWAASRSRESLEEDARDQKAQPRTTEPQQTRNRWVGGRITLQPSGQVRGNLGPEAEEWSPRQTVAQL